MGLISQIHAKIRSGVNAVRRPSDVTAAQHKSVQLNPHCAACGSSTSVQGHHIKPYHKFPDLAAELSNFISLCESVGGLECHLRVGHGGDFKHYNPDVVTDTAAFRAASDSKRQQLWLEMAAKRLLDA